MHLYVSAKSTEIWLSTQSALDFSLMVLKAYKLLLLGERCVFILRFYMHHTKPAVGVKVYTSRSEEIEYGFSESVLIVLGSSGSDD